MTERVVKVGIATYEQQKARLMAMALGEHKPAADEPKIWFSSIESFAQVLSTKNQLLLELIATAEPASVAELETLSGRKGPNLSRTLKTLARFGLVELRRQGRSLAPRAVYDRVSVDLPLLTAAHSRGVVLNRDRDLTPTAVCSANRPANTRIVISPSSPHRGGI